MVNSSFYVKFIKLIYSTKNLTFSLKKDRFYCKSPGLMDEYKFLAPLYDPLLHAVMHRVRRKVVDVVENLPHQSILDICCGTGNQLKYLKRAGFSEITGVDISRSMLGQARKGRDKVTCDEQDASMMHFKDNSFEVGIISFALHEKPEQVARQIISEAQRVVHPRGHLILVDYLFKGHVRLPARMTIHIVERIAGKEHYKYFKQYLIYGGMDHFMDASALKKEYRFHANATGIRVYAMNKYGQYA